MRFGDNLTVDDFLRDYWQKKPLVLRQAIPGFEPELDINDIAGLACEELAESRLITGTFPKHDWELRHGPFSEQELSGLPDADWTLLVQDVDKHYPPLAELWNHLPFIPRWRRDDLMVSVAAPGGSVGPHIDQYDVFLLQAEGRRRWQISSKFNPERLADSDLNVLRRFTAEQEWVLEPGDILYLPPNIAHYGVAVDTCMTWSFGMRAPSTADLLQNLGEWMAETSEEGQRYRDASLTAATAPGEIDDAAIRGLTDLISNAAGSGDDFRRFIGAFLSRYRLAHEPAPPELQWTEPELAQQLKQGAALRHHPWTRLLWLRHDDSALLFAAGMTLPCPVEVARALCEDPVYGLPPAAEQPEFLAAALALVNAGHVLVDTGD